LDFLQSAGAGRPAQGRRFFLAATMDVTGTKKKTRRLKDWIVGQESHDMGSPRHRVVVMRWHQGTDETGIWRDVRDGDNQIVDSASDLV
jgi:hypothetical protein